jgi:hypothetical protein
MISFALAGKLILSMASSILHIVVQKWQEQIGHQLDTKPYQGSWHHCKFAV